jgi:ABC-type transporter MlaC component
MRSKSSSLLRVSFLALALATPAAFGDGGTARAAAGVELSKAQPAGEVEGFVQASIDKGYSILDNKGISAEERERQFRGFLLSIIDTKRVAIFTLGGYARNASEGDLNAFLTAYDDFAAAMYQGYFNWYTGQRLRVANSVARSADDVVVYADVISPNGRESKRRRNRFSV